MFELELLQPNMLYRMEGLQSIEEIDYQIAENIRVLAEQLGISSKFNLSPGLQASFSLIL